MSASNIAFTVEIQSGIITRPSARIDSTFPI
jgi:hypothetical protein